MDYRKVMYDSHWIEPEQMGKTLGIHFLDYSLEIPQDSGQPLLIARSHVSLSLAPPMKKQLDKAASLTSPSQHARQ